MSRLIDADKMKADLLTVDPRYETMINWCITVLDAQPTIEERKTGRWIGEKKIPVGWDKVDKSCPACWCKCSECGEWLVASDEYLVKGNFCPNCGSYNGGKSNENQNG